MRTWGTLSVRNRTWRLRLTAAALMFAFAAITAVPWLHVLTADGHIGHTCCAAAETPLTKSPAVAAPHVDDACWVCQNIFALTQHTLAGDSFSLDIAHPATPFFARAPQAPGTRTINPATRSQAPPANA